MFVQQNLIGMIKINWDNMKQINTYINEKLRLTTKRTYTCHPKSKDELRDIILQRIKDEGNDCDLNDIDTSKITDMSNLFDVDACEIFKKINWDISMWDVSNVTNMSCMFYKCEKFNCDISKWNVSNVTAMNCMFYRCKNLNADISMWNVSKVTDIGGMFYCCEKFNCNLSMWDVSMVDNIGAMFVNCKEFNQDLDSWDVSNVKNMKYAFFNCPTTPKWYDRKKYD